jgi:acyl CoA:acetate/3-ketoacid CoA transferase alpha subunit
MMLCQRLTVTSPTFLPVFRAVISRYQSTLLPNSKVVGSAKEALEGVDLDGATICVGGFGLGGNPETLLNELSRNPNAKNLIVASLTGGTDGMGIGRLIEKGMVKRLISSYVGENKHLEKSFFGGTLEVRFWFSNPQLE